MTAMSSIVATSAAPHEIFFHLITDRKILTEARRYFGHKLYLPDQRPFSGAPMPDQVNGRAALGWVAVGLL